MKIICARRDLYEGVQAAGRAVSTRTSLPILGHLLIRAEEDKLFIEGTDLEIGMECIVEAKVEEQGALTAPAKILTEVLASLPDADVVLSVDDSNTVNVKCGTSEFTINGLPPEEFPRLPEVRDEVSFTIERDELREGIKKTSFAISQDESRAILTGVLIQVTEDSIRMVATDTHRLSVCECPIVESFGSINAIVPGRALNEITRIVTEVGANVTVKISQSQILFVIDNTRMISRLIEGQFPNYQKVIPTEYTKKLTIPAKQLTDSVKRAEIVARGNSFRMIVATHEGKLIITAESGAIGRVHEEVEVIKEGEDVKIAFNAKYLIDVLSVIDTEAIEVELSGEVSPALIRPQGQDNFTYVLMPMQVE